MHISNAYPANSNYEKSQMRDIYDIKNSFLNRQTLRKNYHLFKINEVFIEVSKYQTRTESVSISQYANS